MSSYREPDPFPTRRLRLVVAARSDRGLERAGNEDAACVVDLAAGRALVPPAAAVIDAPAFGFAALVCDGMGGEEGGEVASHLAVLAIVGSLREAWSRGRISPLGRTLVASIDAAADRIKREAQARPHLARMGTTATLAALSEEGLLCAQVGDSRAYVLRRGGRLTQLTRDQTLAELVRRSGTPGIELDTIGTNIILQAVGSSTRLEVALTETPVGPGDVFLLCSDGLSGVVDDTTIERILSSHEEPDRACEALVARANDNGGPDNVTCVVVRVVS